MRASDFNHFHFFETNSSVRSCGYVIKGVILQQDSPHPAASRIYDIATSAVYPF
jgi:hypothetical protein